MERTKATAAVATSWYGNSLLHPGNAVEMFLRLVINSVKNCDVFHFLCKIWYVGCPGKVNLKTNSDGSVKAFFYLEF